MNIEVTDSNGVVCDEGDVIIRHSEYGTRQKYLGILTSLKKSYDIVLSDGDGHWQAYPGPEGYYRYERICNISDRPELDRFLGQNEFKTNKALTAFIQMLYQESEEEVVLTNKILKQHI